MIYRYRAGLEKYDAAKMAECLSWFPQERVDNILKINHIQGRREKAATYELLVEMMREEGCLKQLPVFHYDEDGKPRLSNYSGLHFNISHCKKAVAVALHHAEVGIDIECRRAVSQALMERVCCEEELSRIRSSADAELEFLRLWTRKEALLKCTGVGIRKDLRNVLSYCIDYKIITEYIAEIDGYLSVCVKI